MFSNDIHSGLCALITILLILSPLRGGPVFPLLEWWAGGDWVILVMAKKNAARLKRCFVTSEAGSLKGHSSFSLSLSLPTQTLALRLPSLCRSPGQTQSPGVDVPADSPSEGLSEQPASPTRCAKI